MSGRRPGARARAGAPRRVARIAETSPVDQRRVADDVARDGYDPPRVSDIDQLIRRQQDAAEHAGRVWMDHVIGEAQRIVPHAEGTLGATGDVTVTRQRGGRIEITGSFSTVYAARQHEELGWTHKPGRRAKYLEEPFKRELPRLAPLVAAAVEKVT